MAITRGRQSPSWFTRNADGERRALPFSLASHLDRATIVFETSIITFFLAPLGIVTPAFLLQKFTYEIVLSFVVSTVVTPTQDAITQAAPTVPMILLYLIGVGVAFLFGKKHEWRA